jgi:hypothetical protein
MNEDGKNFDPLLQLLKLKRQETPPPGYFNNFSSQIIAGIRSGAAAEVGAAARPVSEASWFLQFLQLFEFKPAFAGAFASALCLVVVFGVIYADRPDSGTQPLLQSSDPSLASYAALTPATMPATPFAGADMIASNSPASSLQPVASVFDSGNALVQPVSFSPAGN